LTCKGRAPAAAGWPSLLIEPDAYGLLAVCSASKVKVVVVVAL